jgi:hypothetical protein
MGDASVRHDTVAVAKEKTTGKILAVVTNSG